MAEIISIFSAKGGAGKTLIATNLAAALSKQENKKVLLLDLELETAGDMSRMLGLSCQKTMADLINALKVQTTGVKKQEFLTVYSPGGFDFLPAVLRPQMRPYIEPRFLKHIFELFTKDYDFIIVDVGKAFNETQIEILNQSNLILFVVTPDILSIYQARWALDILQSLHFPLRMIKIIINRAASASALSWEELQVSLPCEIISRIPSEGKVAMQSINQASPLVLFTARSKIRANIKKLSSQLILNSEMFISHKQINQLCLREDADALGSGGEFWEKMGLTEKLARPSVNKRPEDKTLLLKRHIHSRLIDKLDLKKLDLKVFNDPTRIKALTKKAEKIITNLLAEESDSFIPSYEARKTLIKEIIDEAIGYGPLEDLLGDPDITDIMVNNKDEIYIERKGKIEPTPKRFISDEQVRTIIDRIIAPIGRRIDESTPMVDARLPDGSRVNAIIPPLSLTGPTLTIRKFRKERFKIEELIDIKTLNSAMGQFLKACVLSCKNIIVSGGTGSGKTTILNVLSAFIPNNERIITIEDAAELKLNQEHWIRLESRPPNIEGKGAVTIRDLFRNTLRMRPDRIVIGECRSLETLDMLQAMNTGHDGSMTTIHANSTHDVLTRLDSMILMSGVELPIRAIREMIASAIDIIVHTARLSDGKRRIMQITEVAGIGQGMEVILEDIFEFRQRGLDNQGNILGEFCATGYRPSFYDELRLKGISIDERIFTP
jgi:septum site-determining protein MinD